MNQRIRQLALEAFQPINDITSEGVADRRTFDQAWFQHYNQKFAELIVRECRDIVEQDMKLSHIQMSPLTLEKYANGRLKEKIKEHFGVEE